jgi:hypothetical protein
MSRRLRPRGGQNWRRACYAVAGVVLLVAPCQRATSASVARGGRLAVKASTFFGGSGSDIGLSAIVVPSGDLFVVGTTDSPDLPVKNAFQPSYGGGDPDRPGDVFVARYSAGGTRLEYATYLGGSGGEYLPAITVDADGSAYVVGSTLSMDFPTVSPLQSTRRGDGDGFIAKIDPGGRLVYSTYFGGANYDTLRAVAVGSDGSIFAAGSSLSPDFPTTPGSFQPESRNTSFDEAVIVKLSPDGQQLVYGSHIGGIELIASNGFDGITDIAVDHDGCAYATGYTTYPDMPTVNAAQPEFGGPGIDAFVCKFSADGSSLVYSTFLGGLAADTGVAIAVDATGSAVVVGEGGSADFPSVNPPLPKPISDDYYRLDGFVAKLSPDGRTFVYSGAIGGNRQDVATAVAVDAAGNAYVVGRTESKDFPVLRALQRRRAGSHDTFLVGIRPTGEAIASTYFGGSAYEFAFGVGADGAGGVFVAGFTASSDFPIKRPVQRTIKGDIDAFVTRFRFSTGS